MGIKLIGRGKTRKRFVFETEDERDILEDARNYFQSSTLLFNEGLGYNFLRGGANSLFYYIKRGRQSNRGIASVSIENWRRTKVYAYRKRRGENYDPETFVRPNFSISEKILKPKTV